MDSIGRAEEMLGDRSEAEIRDIYDKVCSVLENLDHEIPLLNTDVLGTTGLDQEGSSEREAWRQHHSRRHSYADLLELADLPPRSGALEALYKTHSLETLFAAIVSVETSEVAEGIRSSDGRKAANALHEKSNQVRKYTLDLFDNGGSWKSKRRAAKKLLPKAVAHARKLDANVFTGEEPWNTIYDWILEHSKN